MKVKFPQYKVTLAVSSHGAMHHRSSFYRERKAPVQ